MARRRQTQQAFLQAVAGGRRDPRPATGRVAADQRVTRQNSSRGIRIDEAISMDLLQSYLKAVRRYLPRAHRDDIVAELSEDLRSQIEEQESELGRPLRE